MKRKIIQIAAFGYSNAHLLNYKGGKIYQGKWTELLFVPGGGICLSDRGAAGSERFHGISVQLLCGWRAAGVRRAAWKGGLWLALPVRTDTGTDTQDPIAQTKVKENISVSQISGPCRVCLRAPGHSDQLYGHGKTGFLPVYLSGGHTAGRDPAARHTRGAAADDRRSFFAENGDIDRDSRGLYFHISVFLPHTLPARGYLWHHEQDQSVSSGSR